MFKLFTARVLLIKYFNLFFFCSKITNVCTTHLLVLFETLQREKYKTILEQKSIKKVALRSVLKRRIHFVNKIILYAYV